MRIDNFNIEQHAVSKYQRVERKVVNIQLQELSVKDALDISDKGLTRVEGKDDLEDYLSESDKRKIELLESFITWLTGKKFKFKRLASEEKLEKDPKTNGNKKGRIGQPGFGMRLYARQEIYEKESMSFSSKGVVKTKDGRSIDFEFNMHMSRETYKKNEMLLKTGNFHDPLVLNFDGQGVDFGDKKIKIDLNLDGLIDEFNFLSPGSGFLAFDKNNNGIIDDGNELFGPKTNDGFSQLRAYDLDGNNWIDETDDIFDALSIWTVDKRGEPELIGLKEAGVGAIYLSDVTSNYTIKHGDSDMAKISSSSIYLKESGKVGVIHEVDIKI